MIPPAFPFYMKNDSLQIPNRITIAALFTAAAVTVYLLEFMLPRPLPFLKLGLANVFILILLAKHDYLIAFAVTISKSVIGGLFSGMLISPHTLLSLGGSLSAFCVMSLLIAAKLPFSLVGISIAGAVSHNLTQLFLVNFVLIRDESIYLFFPFLLLLGIITGSISGFFADKLNKKITFLFV